MNAPSRNDSIKFQITPTPYKNTMAHQHSGPYSDSYTSGTHNYDAPKQHLKELVCFMSLFGSM